jgi:hypothetical protein
VRGGKIQAGRAKKLKSLDFPALAKLIQQGLIDRKSL